MIVALGLQRLQMGLQKLQIPSFGSVQTPARALFEVRDTGVSFLSHSLTRLHTHLHTQPSLVPTGFPLCLGQHHEIGGTTGSEGLYQKADQHNVLSAIIRRRIGLQLRSSFRSGFTQGGPLAAQRDALLLSASKWQILRSQWAEVISLAIKVGLAPLLQDLC